MVLKKTLEGPLDCKEMKSVNPKGNQPWIFIGRTDAEAPILWTPDTKSRLIGKDPGARKDWWQGEKRPPEDEMIGWNHWLNGCESEQTPGYSEGLESLAMVHGVTKSRIRLVTEQQQDGIRLRWGVNDSLTQFFLSEVTHSTWVHLGP